MTHSSTCIEKIGEGVRAEAIHKAKENARSTASQMRVKLGKITNIQDLHVEVKKLHEQNEDSLELKQIQLRKSKTKLVSASVKLAYALLN